MKTKSNLFRTRTICGLALVALALNLTLTCIAAAATFSDANWISTGGVPGATGRVRAAVVDGTGNLYIGGDFTLAGDVIANGIAKWNGTNWSALGSGISAGVHSYVAALAVSGTNVYAGGWFHIAGGIAAATNLAQWDGSSWSPLGSGVGGVVAALRVSGSDLYAGGFFTTAGGIAANHVAKWDGSNWSALGSGMRSDIPDIGGAWVLAHLPQLRKPTA